MAPSTHQVAIIGAGPYGLSAAAHLRAAGLDVQVFGEAMTFWRQHMPRGMLLRSPWAASHMSDPERTLTLDAYQVAEGVTLPRPLPLERFVAYGQWFQRAVVPDLDRRRVVRVEPVQPGFRLTLEDGETRLAHRVVIAAGIGAFAHHPPRFSGFPPALVSHTVDHDDLSRFRGQRVVVVGGGQSALESAALLSEGGAEVEVVMRAPQVRWLTRSAWLQQHLKPVHSLMYPPSDVGPPILNWIVALPDVFRLFPRALQPRMAYRAIRPAAAGWLAPRVTGVRITAGRSVAGVMHHGEGLRLRLDDGSEREVDHVLLATGYRVEIARWEFLAPEIVRAIRRDDGYPSVGPGFETTVAGLHVVGAPAALAYGPLMRFVAGSRFTATRLARAVAAGARSAAVPMRVQPSLDGD